MVVRKVVALNVVSKCDLYALLFEITSIMCITFLMGSIVFTSSCKYVKFFCQGKIGCFDYQSGKSQGILTHVSGMNSESENFLLFL